MGEIKDILREFPAADQVLAIVFIDPAKISSSFVQMAKIDFYILGNSFAGFFHGSFQDCDPAPGGYVIKQVLISCEWYVFPADDEAILIYSNKSVRQPVWFPDYFRKIFFPVNRFCLCLLFFLTD